MKLSKGHIGYQNRIQAVEKYLISGSLKEVAFSFNIHQRTLRRWIKLRQDGGNENLRRKKIYKRHLKRFAPLIEKNIVMLKEKQPSFTLSEARDILNENGIKISIKGIWCIWNRYNLMGFRRSDSQSNEKNEITPEMQDGLKKAEQALNEGDTRKAAQILNALPSCAGKEILKRIPDRLLALPRRVEKLDLTFGEIPFRKTMRKARNLRIKAQKKDLLYLSIRAGCSELDAMAWVENPEKQLVLVNRLLAKLRRKHEKRDNSNTILRFNLLVSEGIALGILGRIREALSCIRKCETICRRLSTSSFCSDIAALYSMIGSFKKARSWLLRSLEYAKAESKMVLHELRAGYFAKAGEYRNARKILKNLYIEKRGLKTLRKIIEAQCLIGEGKLQEAVKFANQALCQSKKETIHKYVATTSMICSCCLCAFGEEKKAKALIRSISPMLKKTRMGYDFLLTRILLGQDIVPKDATLSPELKVAFLLHKVSHSFKIKDYRKAFNYATSQQLMGLFHRLVLFFPGPVNKLLVKGKPTGLPKALLKLPVFQKNIPVYHLRFLGPVCIYRNGVRLRHEPTPMYASFLIHLSFNKKTILESLYENFWSHAKDPKGSLSHLLYSFRKYLKLPPNTLFIKSGFLNFKGYITTDYQFYEETITRAKALKRAGEWVFAKKEYLRAFRMFRGEPFRKMYDPWSEHMRRVILNELEGETMHFAKSCLEHDNEIRQKKRRTPSAKCRGGNMADAKRVLEKVAKIIPNSEEIRRMVK
jgi:tetratricopeptide (TPR) repeat protein